MQYYWHRHQRKQRRPNACDERYAEGCEQRLPAAQNHRLLISQKEFYGSRVTNVSHVHEPIIVGRHVQCFDIVRNISEENCVPPRNKESIRAGDITTDEAKSEGLEQVDERLQ